jgi:hypothetical protein
MRTSASAANLTRLHAHNAASTDQNISSLKNIAHPPWSVIKSQKEKARMLILALSQPQPKNARKNFRKQIQPLPSGTSD